jgi:hypothetical protein
VRGQLAYRLAVERHEVRHPDAVESGKQQQRVLQWVSEHVRQIDQLACFIERSPCIGRRMTLGMHQYVRKRDLQLDLFAVQRGRGRQSRNLIHSAGELCCRFN